MEKWDPANPSCVFKHYFYNKVDEAHIPFYKPQPYEDPREWEEALQNKPAPGFMPVLCSGYAGVADRLKTQKRAVSEFNARLHQVNGSLDAILQRHELETEVRALAARRRQTAISERCLALAARVQVLRNRGYALSGDEDDLKNRLQSLERDIQDPAVGAREEELWSRLIVLRRYSDRLNKEMDQPASAESQGLDVETEAKAKRVNHSSHPSEPTRLLTKLSGPGRLREAAPAPQEGAGGAELRLRRVGDEPQGQRQVEVTQRRGGAKGARSSRQFDDFVPTWLCA